MNKKKIAIIVGIVILVLLLIFFIMGLFRRGPMNNRPVVVNYPEVAEGTTYEGRIFDTSYIHLVEVTIAEEDWQDLITNPLDKTKYKVNVVIDGVEFKDVSFSTKGNSSLSNVAEGPRNGPASNRYSFKINFGKYVEDQTYFGLDKLHLNNFYGDATYLNDFMSYEVFRQLNVPTPLDSYVYLKINGADFGVYLALEEVGESFFERNKLIGNLYKPEQTGGKDQGASLTYVDDDRANYVNIFDNAENSIGPEDETRMISSIKKLNQKEELDKVVDVDEVISYFVAHNYVLSYDSYTGPSIHNYYLAEKDGMLSMIPWDYNLAFGRFNMTGGETFIVNYGIDTPLWKAHQEDRPMWNWIISDKGYRDKYHKQMDQLLNSYFESGEYEKKIDSTYAIIKPYVQQDRTAFYSPQQVDTAVQALKDFSNLRTQSIRAQLDGKLSCNTKDQKDEDKIDASSLKLDDLGLVADDSKKNNQQGGQGGPQGQQGQKGQQPPER